MDENNNSENRENGFIMRETPDTGADREAITEDVREENSETTMNTGRWAGTETDSQAAAGSDSGASPEKPQPMPADNTYRFQNNAPKTAKKPVGKSAMPKAIGAAVVFGIVAAVCFAGVTALIHGITGKNSSNPETIGNTSSVAPVTIASGGAATAYDVSSIVDQVMPSIVAITEKTTKTSYFGQKYSATGAGSGFIVKQDGNQLLIVTNNHVVADADEISVQFNDGEVADAKVKGTSPANDLAVITVEIAKLKSSTKQSIRVATLGSSDEARVGQMVIAIGNALGYGQSVTVGYLSAKNREVTSTDGSNKNTTQILLQTDAAINPGNSGGALIDTTGKVIGINSSKYFYYGSSNVEGMGYAIPMSDAVPVINELMNREVLKEEERGYLGITGRSINESVKEAYGIPVGVYVVSLSENGAAKKGGLKQGDIITKINGHEVKTIESVQDIINNTKAGTDVELTIMRSDDGEYKEQKVKVTLKTKETLNGLEEESSENNNNNDSYSNDGSQVIPWGGSGY